MNRLIPVLVLLLALPAAALAAPPKGFDARVEALRQKVGAPAVAVAIVENGKVTLTRAYGVKQMGRPDPVDEHTIFQLGSVTKAFTAAALATLVDEGKIGWDDKVIDHLPYFRMYDPWVTREITIRDLLVHRSGLGLGEGDLMFVPATTISRKEGVERLRYLKPATSFRSAYAYDNVLYMVAGQLIEEVTGLTSATASCAPRVWPTPSPASPSGWRWRTVPCRMRVWARFTGPVRRKFSTRPIRRWDPTAIPPARSRPAPTTWPVGCRCS